VTPKLKSPPAEPGAELRRSLDELRDEIARSEASVPAFEDEANTARVAHDAPAVAMAMAGLAGAYAELDRLRTEEARLTAELMPIERAKVEDACCRQIVDLSKVNRQGLEERNQDIDELASHLLKVIARNVDRQEQFGGVMQRIDQIAVETMEVHLVGNLYSTTVQNNKAREALLHRLDELGADVQILEKGWDARRNPEHYGYWIEQMLDAGYSHRAHLRHVAENAEQEKAVKARLEAANVA
jgi:hypothetical protein